ncbi:MAG: hypothetical protein ACI909_002228 [Planctomycetota bacterium]|jgi:hypothetical protein
MLYSYFHRSLGWGKFGQSPLSVESDPLYPGGKLKAYVKVEKAYQRQPRLAWNWNVLKEFGLKECNRPEVVVGTFSNQAK